MTDELMEQRMAELNARNTEKAPAFDSEKRAYSVDDITCWRWSAAQSRTPRSSCS